MGSFEADEVRLIEPVLMRLLSRFAYFCIA